MSVGTTAALIIGGVAAAGSIGSAVIGANAAGNAANVQANAANAAAAKEQPWVTAGQTSLSELMQGFQNGTYGPGSIPAFTAPTAQQAEATPGYGFTQSQGLRAVEAAGSQAGNSLGGATLKAAEQFGTGLANSTYNDTFNRSLASYQAQLQGQNQSFNQLLGVSNQGQSAAVGVGNLMTQAGNAQAAGIVGQANAISGGITGSTGDISQTLLLNKLLTQNTAQQGVSAGPSPAALENAGALVVPPLPANIGGMSGYGPG